MKLSALIMAYLTVLVAGCASTDTWSSVPLGTARAAADFRTYDLRRVGVLPPSGESLPPEFVAALRDALAAAFAAETPYEIVPLGLSELESIGPVEPFRTGRTQPEPILALARRAGLDGILVPRVTELRSYEPVQLGLEVELVAVETGFSIWSARVRTDAADRRTIEAVQAWQIGARMGGPTERAVDLMSPRRMGEFAAWEVARLL
ncbi:MAG: hypothetical protein JNK02_08050 [Planctomycetes bacterium]|nr:hypothetical protein [Planctomycetota bacterium]